MDFDTPSGGTPELAQDAVAAALTAKVEGGPAPTEGDPQSGTVVQGGGTTTQPQGGEEDWKTKYEALETEHRGLQGLYGRQTVELGELRKQSEPAEEEEYESYDPTLPALLTETQAAEIEDLFMRYPGEQVAFFIATNHPHLLEGTLDLWAEQGGAAARRASTWAMRYESRLQEIERTQEAEAASAADREMEQALDQGLKAIGPEFGFDVSSPEVDQFIGSVLQEAPPFIQRAVISDDPQDREDGIRAVLGLARAKLATTGVTEPIANGGNDAAISAELNTVKQLAGIGSGSQKPLPVLPGNEGEAPDDAALQTVKALLRQGENTSVAAGLTHG